ncbi:MAG: hypothetical protein WDN45_02805 [Caulobacteraceae bacterium]
MFGVPSSVQWMARQYNRPLPARGAQQPRLERPALLGPGGPSRRLCF